MAVEFTFLAEGGREERVLRIDEGCSVDRVTVSVPPGHDSAAYSVKDARGVEAAFLSPQMNVLLYRVVNDRAAKEYEVLLYAAGGHAIQVMKTLRELFGLGLKEAKAFVDAGGGVAVVRGETQENAEIARDRLRQAGATVEIRKMLLVTKVGQE